MQMRPLGSSGIVVSAIGFGGMPLSLLPTRPATQDAIKVIHAAIDAGITFLDTADAYCIDATEAGHNERLFGQALAELPSTIRHSITVATKCGLVRPDGRWERDGSPAHLRAVTEQSLKNLQVESLTLQQYHRIDPKVPLDQSWGELIKLQKEGKVRHLGASNHSVAELTRALATGATIVSLQNQFSRKHRNPEFDGTLKLSQQKNMAFLAWSPLDGMGGAASLDTRHPGVTKIALARHLTPQQVALTWLLATAPHVIPIPGTTKVPHARECAAAADLKLTAEELAILAAETPLQGPPHQ